MTWPEVFRWLALTAVAMASITALGWAFAAIFRRWVQEAAQDAAEGLHEQLQEVFRHLDGEIKTLSEQVTQMETGIREDASAMEARILDRIDRLGGAKEESNIFGDSATTKH